MAMEFIRSNPGRTEHEEDWSGVKRLGEGAQGRAGLWVRRHPRTKRIVERIVIKEEQDRMFWNKEFHYFGSELMPKEYYMSTLLPPDSKNTIRIESYRKFNDRKAFRLYMEYCALGDMHDLWSLHKFGTRTKMVPEPFIWKVILDLARALVAMQNPIGSGMKKDSFIGHIDFKPGNVFLSPPDRKEYPKYPTLKLADFGGAIVTDPHDSEHLKWLGSCVWTEGFVAPELHVYRLQSKDHNVPSYEDERTKKLLMAKITGKINVWNAGLIAADLMSTNPFTGSKEDPHAARERWLEDFHNNQLAYNNPHYSKWLKSTVKQCLHYRPEHRLTPENFLWRAEYATMRYAGNMATRKCMDSDNGQDEMHFAFKMEDDYAVSKRQDDDED